MKREITTILKEMQDRAKQDPNYYTRLLTNLSNCKNRSCTDESLHLTEDEMDVLREVYRNKK